MSTLILAILYSLDSRAKDIMIFSLKMEEPVLQILEVLMQTQLLQVVI